MRGRESAAFPSSVFTPPSHKMVGGHEATSVGGRQAGVEARQDRHIGKTDVEARQVYREQMSGAGRTDVEV